MTVILDTTVYFSDPNFQTTEMIKLRQLCKDKKITLFIPQIVQKEFKSQEEEKFVSIAKTLLEKIQIRNSKSTCNEEKKILDELQEETKLIIEKCKKSIEIKVDSFVKETNAIVKMLTLNEYNDAFEKYFNNDRPFPKLELVKSREDVRKHIPDSLIFVQVMNKKGDDVVFISKDKNLRESVKAIGVTSYSDLLEFIESDKIKAVIDYKNADDFLFKYFNENFNHNNKNISEMINQSLEKELYYKNFIDRDIPDDNNEGTITGINVIYSLEIINNKILNLGNGLFSVPFSCKIDANIEYYIFKADFYCLDEDRMKNISIEDWNRHYYQAEESLILSCDGKIGIQFNIDMSEMIEIQDIKIDDLLKDINLSFSDLNIEVE